MTKPPFRADHVGSLLRPNACSRRASGAPAARSPPRRCARSRTTRSRRRSRQQEEVGLQGITDGEFRRTFFHVDFLERLEGVRGRRERLHRELPARRRQRGRLQAADHAGHRQAAPRRRASRAPTSTSSKAQTTRTPKVCIPSPSMLHFRGGREAIERRALPRSRGVLRRSRRGLSRRDRRPRRPRLPLSAARRHQPRLSVRSDRSANRPAPAATIRTNCRAPTAG